MFRKFIPVLVFGLILSLVIYFVEAPKQFSQLSFFKGLLFFTPLFLFLISINNIIFRSLARSVVVTVGIIMGLVLQGVGKLNPLSGILLIITITFIVRFLKRKEAIKYPTKIPKLLKLQKQ